MKIIRSLVTAFAVVFLTTAAIAGDPTGTWTWKRQTPNGEIESTMKLQLQDGKLSGTVSGWRGAENPISKAKFENDELSFDVVVDFNGNQFTSKYQGKLAGDTITGSIEFARRDGGTRTVDWSATRSK